MHAISAAAASGITDCYDFSNRYSSYKPDILEHKPHAFTAADTGIRIRINVRGLIFETYEQTLAQYPETLLGSPSKRVEYYNPLSKEYFFDRDKSVFDSILFFYQSCGILSCPDHVPRENFLEEIKFFQLHEADKRYKQEIEPVETSKVTQVDMPEHPLRRKIWQLFEYPDSSFYADLLAKFSLIVIIMSTITFCIETLPSFGRKEICLNVTAKASNDSEPYNGSLRNSLQSPVALETHCYVKERGSYWQSIETAYVVWFTFEYLMRAICAPRRIKFLTSALGIVDVLAILPFYITLLIQDDGLLFTSFPVLRVIRLVRVLRVLKLSRYSKGLKVLAKTLIISGKDLPSLLAVLVINIVLFSSVVYYVENDIKNNDFKSIPDAFWWAIVTMTAVGYGDKVPKGAVGKLIGAICAISGIVVLFCLPTPVLLSHFEEIYKRKSDPGKKSREIVKQEEECSQSDGVSVDKKQTEVHLFGERERSEIYI